MQDYHYFLIIGYFIVGIGITCYTVKRWGKANWYVYPLALVLWPILALALLAEKFLGL